MKTSSIIRLEDDPFVVIRKSYTEICGGNQYAAALINYYEHRHNAKVDEVDECLRTIRGFKVSQSDYIIKASDDYLSEVALQKLCGSKCAGIANHLLNQLGFITLIQNIPNPNGGSPVNHAILNTEKLNQELERYSQFKRLGKPYQFQNDMQTKNHFKKSSPSNDALQSVILPHVSPSFDALTVRQMTLCSPSNDAHQPVKRRTAKGKMTDNNNSLNDKFVNSSLIAHEKNELEPNEPNEPNELFLKKINLNGTEQNERTISPGGGAAAQIQAAPQAQRTVNHTPNSPNLFFEDVFPNFQTLEAKLKAIFPELDFELAFNKWKLWADSGNSTHQAIRHENWEANCKKMARTAIAEGKLLKKVAATPAQPTFKNPVIVQASPQVATSQNFVSVPGVEVGAFSQKAENSKNTEGVLQSVIMEAQTQHMKKIAAFENAYDNLTEGTFTDFRINLGIITRTWHDVVGSGIYIAGDNTREFLFLSALMEAQENEMFKYYQKNSSQYQTLAA
jgi:hypothetical protein